ncbi:MAG TPA: nitrilase-related carbon-nitrogen hydrolase [bacterium]|nr:nitrilase-related carbon-nitrogen hydrolase [bacterium]
MKRLRLAIDQMAPVLGDLDANFKRHQDAIAWAKTQKADLLVFPELSLSGYLVRGMVHHVGITRDDPRLLALAGAAGGMSIVLGMVEKSDDGQFFNVGCYLRDGRVAAIQRKLILPNYGMFEERRFMASGAHLECFDTPWGKAGILICFDLLHPATVYLLEQSGAHLLISISASPARGISAEGHMAGEQVFRVAQEAAARLCGLMTVYVNRVGVEEGVTFWGGSQVMDPFGVVLCELPMYEAARAVCEIDMESVSRARTLFPHLKESRPDLILQEMWRLRQGAAPMP